MATNLIVTISKSTIHSLAHQGILVYESFHQIRDLVRAHLGDAYALLFAEPSLSKDGSSIDWYTPVQGTARRLVDLPEEEQKAARAATVRMAQDLARVAAELRHSGIASQVTRGTILELALQYPDESCIYLVGEQPLFTCWGFGPGTPGAQPQNLTRLGQVVTPPKAPTPQAAPATQPATMQTRSGGVSWLWLLPLLLLPLLFILLTASFGGNAPLIPIPGFNFRLPALPFLKMTPNLSADSEKELSAKAEKLRAEIHDLEKTLLDRAEQCPPAPAQERQALVIPKKPLNMNFLHGSWLCDLGLVNKTDGQPIVVFFDFDSSGKGTATVRQKGRGDCVGPTVASMNAQGILSIKSERLICPDGRNYGAQAIECRGDAANRAMCSGKSEEGTSWGSVPFYRIDGTLAAAEANVAEGEKEPAAEAEKLRTEIHDLEKKLLDRVEQCPPEAAPPDKAAAPDQERKALVIPEKPSDMNFLRGRWLCDRGLFSKADGQPLILLYDFDADGKGTATVRQKGRKDCVGPAVASMNAQGVLIIEAERQNCPNGRSYSAETIECRGDAANRAMCRGKSGQGTDWGESVPFYKID